LPDGVAGGKGEDVRAGQQRQSLDPELAVPFHQAHDGLRGQTAHRHGRAGIVHLTAQVEGITSNLRAIKRPAQGDAWRSGVAGQVQRVVQGKGGGVAGQVGGAEGKGIHAGGQFHVKELEGPGDGVESGFVHHFRQDQAGFVEPSTVAVDQVVRDVVQAFIGGALDLDDRL
jgi:hypothetical protein